MPHTRTIDPKQLSGGMTRVIVAAVAVIAMLILASGAGATEFDFKSSFGSSGSGAGKFDTATWDAVDATNGYVYVSDFANTVTGKDDIQRFNLDGSSPVAIGPNFEGGTHVCTEDPTPCFSGPEGLAVDPTSHDLYVADEGVNGIVKLSPTGTYLGRIDSFDSGGGPDNDAFNGPVGIAVDPTGNLFVADQGKERVVEFDKNGAFVQTFGNEGAASDQFERPEGVAVDGNNHLWVTDTDFPRVSEWNTTTGDHVANFGTATAFGATPPPLGTFSDDSFSPQGIAYTPGDGDQTPPSLLVVDTGNRRVEQFALNGSPIAQFGGQGSADGQFQSPVGVATYVDATTGVNAYVVDQTIDHVQRFVPAQPPSNTALPVLTGTAQQGQSLTATDGTWTNSPTSYTHSWQSCNANADPATCVTIAGQSGSTYAVADTAVGDRIRACVVAHNGVGDSAVACSGQSAVVLGPPPSNTGLPVITGAAVQGQALTATSGTWTNAPSGFVYDWERCDTAGANCADTGVTTTTAAATATYTLVALDAGHEMRVKVTASNPGGSSTPAESAPTANVVAPPVNQGAPTITGSAYVGSALTGANGTWSDDAANAYVLQWRLCDATGGSCGDITGATGPSYTPVATDLGHTIRLRVTATNAAGSASFDSDPTAAVTAPPPVNSAAPVVTGTAQQGQTLTASTGTWSNDPSSFTYQWQRCDASGANCADIAGATGATYTPTADDVGHTVLAAVTAQNGTGGTEVSSVVTGVIVATPVPVTTTTGGGSPPPPPPAPTSPVTVISATQFTPPASVVPAATLLSAGVPVALVTTASAQIVSELLLDAKTAKKLHLGNGKHKVIVGTAAATAAANGNANLHVQLTHKAHKALQHIKKYKLQLRIIITDATKHTFTISRTVTIKKRLSATVRVSRLRADGGSARPDRGD